MSISKIDICNMALAFIGQRSIASLDEHTPEAMQCSRFYEAALEQVLRDHPWNFAQSREKMPPVAVPEGWAREYPLAYAYPANALQLHHLIDPNGAKSRSFRVAQGDRRTVVLTAIPDAIGAFTVRVEDTTRFDPLFAQILARKVQGYLVKPLLKNNPSLVREAEELYARELSRAKLADAREGEAFSESESYWNGGHDNPWIAGRLGCFR